MKLSKDKWQYEVLENIFKLKSGYALPQSKIIEGNCPVYGGNGIVGYHNEYMVKTPTLVIGRVGEYCGSIYLTKEESWVTDNGLYPIEYFKEVSQEFLKESLIYANLNHYARKTGQPSISQSSISLVKIPFPPIEEQQLIADLFQSIEQSLDKIERQEKNLKGLQKTLSNGLLSNTPVFGNLLSDKNTKPSSFGAIADCIQQSDKTPLKNGINRFVGLENIEPENFILEGYGNIEDGTTFTKCFKTGDVLFGKRRAYLKKVAITDFDGICSGDILVLRAKEKTMLPELLPYYVSSEAFINHAVSTSAGSLSPRTKWKDLSQLELSIPDLKTQEKIIEVFNELKKSLLLITQQKLTLKNLKQKLLEEILG